jgi:hypothetical protein
MNNINLLESAQGKNGLNGSSIRRSGAFIIPFLILIFIFLAWGGTKFYSSHLTGQIAEENSKIQSETATLSGKNVDRVIDFNERMNRSLKETSSRSNINDCFKDLENSMVSGARIDSLSYSEDRIDIKVVADNFQTVARQILSFKNSNYFKDLKMAETSRDADGKVNFSFKK